MKIKSLVCLWKSIFIVFPLIRFHAHALPHATTAHARAAECCPLLVDIITPLIGFGSHAEFAKVQGPRVVLNKHDDGGGVVPVFCQLTL